MRANNSLKWGLFMKKIISIVCSIAMLITTISMALPAFASTGNSIDTVVEELSELNRQEAESGKELEESAECRIIVKANRKPDTYGDAQFVKGTNKIYIYQYSDVTSANAALEYYNSLSYVQWAETDGIMEGQSLSYGNDMMGSDEAKNYIKNNNISTNEVNIAVIDGGINFKKKDFINSGRVIDSGFNSSNTGAENSAQQDNGNYHGSNITSIILDNTTDNVNIIGYKVMNSEGKGTNLAVASGIEKATDDDVDIINLSLGGEGGSQLIVDAVNEAVAQGIVIICSSGNAGDDVANYGLASMDNVITVGAVDYNGNIACFSNFGEEVDFVAPGYNVEVYGNKNISSGKPDYVSGTSFSAPFVASAAAIVLSVNPDLSPSDVKNELIKSCINRENINYSSPYLRNIEIDSYSLRNTLVKSEAKSENLYYGNGLPQMENLVGVNDKCSTPEFSASSGTYNDEFELEITANSDSEIYYTIDGSYPSVNSISYSEPITISETTCIRAIAYSDDKVKSIPSAREYKIEYLADENDFEIDDRGYITGYNGKGKNGNYIEIKVPDTINGMTVQGVAKEAFLDTMEEDEIEEFGEYDIHLKGISLPVTVEEIEDYSFMNSYSLKYFTAPGLKTVGDFALDAPIVYLNASNIEYIGDNGLSTNLSEINLPYLKYAGNSAFCENIYLDKVYLPMLDVVRFFSFGNCYRVNTIELNNAKKIENAAFKECCYLKHLNISNAEIFTDDDFGIDNYMFYRCNNINEIYLPKLQGEIPDHCFQNCRSLKTLYMPFVSYIGDNSLDLCYELEMLYIPNVKEIASTLFIINGIMFVPSLEKTVYLPYSDNVEIYLSDKFKSYQGNSAVSFDYTIIAPLNSYAHNLANENNWSFISSDNREIGQTNAVNVNNKGRSICVTAAGLRFGFEWTEISEIEELATDIEYGLIYSQKGVEDLSAETVDGSTVKSVIANNRIDHGDTTSFNLVISNIPNSYYEREITARAYVCIDGMYFYSNMMKGSFGGVAELVLADNEIDINTKNAINNLLGKEV